MATQCIPLDQITGLQPWEIPTLYSCDVWPVPHILVPMLAGLFTKWPLFGFFIAGVWEIIEILILMIFQTFNVFFVGPDANSAYENLGQAFIDDWLIHGGIGTLLAWTLLHTFDMPLLVDFGEFWTKLYKFWYYVFAFIILALPLSTWYGYEIDGIRLGVLIAPFLQLIVIGLIVLTEPKATWLGYSRVTYWMCWWPLSLALNISNMFGWFYSGAIQAWLLTGIYYVILLGVAQYRNKWLSLIYVDWDEVNFIETVFEEGPNDAATEAKIRAAIKIW